MKYVFPHRQKSEANRELQRRLINEGFPPEADDPTDGIFGTETEKALGRFQAYHGIPVRDPPQVDERTFAILFPEVIEQMENDLTQNTWWSKLSRNTLLQYGLVFLGGGLAAKLGLDPDLFKQGIPDILKAIGTIISGIVAIMAAFQGMKSAATPKAVVDGKVVPLKHMAPSEQEAIAAIVEKRAA